MQNVIHYDTDNNYHLLFFSLSPSLSIFDDMDASLMKKVSKLIQPVRKDKKKKSMIISFAPYNILSTECSLSSFHIRRPSVATQKAKVTN